MLHAKAHAKYKQMNLLKFDFEAMNYVAANEEAALLSFASRLLET